jgi:hypothetical protein
MKWAVYSLILVNLAFALWHYRFQEKNSSTIDEDETLRLVLLKEYLARQETDTASSRSGAGESANGNCYTLGPFRNKKAVASVRDRMVAVGIDAKRRLDKNNTRKGFWVIIPPESTRKKANQHIRALKQKGVKDYFLVVTGEFANAVSLGVFVNSDSAERRYEVMKKQGFDARVQTVDLPVREYWLDWSKEQILLPEVLSKFREEFPGIGQAERGCVIE